MVVHCPSLFVVTIEMLESLEERFDHATSHDVAQQAKLAKKVVVILEILLTLIVVQTLDLNFFLIHRTSHAIYLHLVTQPSLSTVSVNQTHTQILFPINNKAHPFH